ncbi:hypothetical protein X777_01274, partial [Ooceraea biroi]
LEEPDGKGEGHYRKRALPLYYAMSRTRANICSVCSNILPPNRPRYATMYLYTAVVARGSRGLSGCWFGSIALVCFTIQRRSATLFKYSGCSVVVGARQ